MKKMTDGEKMVWAAVFARHRTKELERYDDKAIVAATIAVLDLRENHSTLIALIKNRGMGVSESIEMYEEMIGENG
ncbi:MAG: hypothetical protein DRJ03_11655 [Chloroflexi bacterium]|nr:MAG: hypothetical protein DRJ03_11655 [Chloroflexota bacterium]